MCGFQPGSFPVMQFSKRIPVWNGIALAEEQGLKRGTSPGLHFLDELDRPNHGSEDLAVIQEMDRIYRHRFIKPACQPPLRENVWEPGVVSRSKDEGGTPCHTYHLEIRDYYAYIFRPENQSHA